MSLGTDLVARARSLAGRFYYTNDWWSRMNPWESGGTDCSGFCRLVYGEFGYDIGTWTGDESHAGREVARGHYPNEIPWDIMQPGDLIFMTATYWNNYDFDEYLCHVEIYCGGGTMIGHPGGYGPQEKWAQAWMEAYGCITWKVMRIIEEDEVSASELWGYKNQGMNGDRDVYQMMTDMWVALCGPQDKCTSSLAYMNKGLEKVDVYQIVRDGRDYSKKAWEAVTGIRDAVAGMKAGNVDVNMLAEAVADKLTSRMAD